MNNFLFFYAEANIACISIALLIIFRELRNVDKQVRNIEFIKTVFVYIIFYIVDIIWAFNEPSFTKRSSFLGYFIYFFIFLSFTYGSCQWFIYSEVAQGDSQIYKFKNRIKWILPFLIFGLFVFIYTLVVYCSGSKRSFCLYVKIIHVLMVFTSFFYEAMASIKSLVRVVRNKKHPGKGWFFYMGINPLLFSSFIIIQFIFIHIPIFCFLNTILMLCFYLKSLDDVISIDSLTKLNNRNQLNKYFHQIHEEEDFINYILVIDIDDFKSINDKYGHLEGDNALKLVADSFREVCGRYNYKCFISRYGGDEFVIIVQAVCEDDVIRLKSDLNKKIELNSKKNKKSYELSVSIGFSQIKDYHEKIEHSLEKADKEMYLEKQRKAASRK